MHRFFVPPESISQGLVTFDAALAHQLRNVLRMRPGEQVTALDDSGWEYLVELTSLEPDRALGCVCGQNPSQGEPRLRLTLYQSMLKGDRFEWVLQKGTELGVSAFVPVLSRRSVVRDAGRMEKRRPRWERILREAAEQSRRGRLPQLAVPVSFDAACRESVRVHDLSLIPWEDAGTGSLLDALRALDAPPKSVALLIGPEGGFEREEVMLARRQEIGVVTLGPRILRAETAALASVAIVMSELGEMGAGR
ncbi:MAG: 16S rRNA (uracil(1498)-N(3))-methyltransferase [Anaerolineae bacterium]|nr:16S rRNA (uracil(1498)-N(3))-methyltransferase [Anaerolineae bacterium]